MWPQLTLRSARTLRHLNKVDDDDDDDDDDNDDDDDDDDNDGDNDDDDDDVSFRPLLIFLYYLWKNRNVIAT